MSLFNAHADEPRWHVDGEILVVEGGDQPVRIPLADAFMLATRSDAIGTDGLDTAEVYIRLMFS